MGFGWCRPSIMGLGPIGAVREATKKINWSIDEIDLFETNEAFAAQSIAIRELGIDQIKLMLMVERLLLVIL